MKFNKELGVYSPSPKVDWIEMILGSISVIAIFAMGIGILIILN